MKSATGPQAQTTDQRMARADYWQIVLAIIALLGVPMIGAQITTLVRIAVLETKVEDLRAANGLPRSDVKVAANKPHDET